MGKPALARAYASWSRHDDVHPDAQAKELDARVILTDRRGEELASVSHTFVRPDLWHSRGIKTKAAQHTAQVYGFEPRAELELPLRLALEIESAPGQTSQRYSSYCPTEIWDKRPKLSVDVYIAEVLEWDEGGAIDAMLPTVRNIVRDAQIYAEQLFPVAEVEFSAVEVFSPWRLPDSPTGCDLSCWINGYVPELSARSKADMALAFFPHNKPSGGKLLGGHTSARFPNLGVLAFAVSDTPEHQSRYVNGVVHEMGHVLGLDHVPTVDDPERSDFKSLRNGGATFWFGGIEGFRMEPSGLAGYNKSSVEGNEESASLVPLMAPMTMDREQAFIARHQYLLMQASFDQWDR